jgi:hypothetical protein
MEIGEEIALPWLTFSLVWTSGSGRHRVVLLDVECFVSPGGLLEDGEVEETLILSTSTNVVDVEEFSTSSGFLVEEGGVEEASILSISTSVVDVELFSGSSGLLDDAGGGF